MEKKTNPENGLTVSKATEAYVLALRYLEQSKEAFLEAYRTDKPAFDIDSANEELGEAYEKARTVIQAVIVERVQMFAEASARPSTL
jgi:hypothetical protein